MVTTRLRAMPSSGGRMVLAALGCLCRLQEQDKPNVAASVVVDHIIGLENATEHRAATFFLTAPRAPMMSADNLPSPAEEILSSCGLH